MKLFTVLLNISFLLVLTFIIPCQTAIGQVLNQPALKKPNPPSMPPPPPLRSTDTLKTDSLRYDYWLYKSKYQYETGTRKYLSRYADVCKAAPNPADSIYRKFNFNNCAEVKACFGPKYESDDVDIQTIKHYYYHLKKQNCQNDSLHSHLIVKLYELEPTPKRARRAGQKYYKMGDYDKAIHYFEQSLNFEPDKLIEAKTYMFMARAERKKSHELTPFMAKNARKYAYKAIELMPDWDSPYLFIGDLYADSMELCGADDITGWKEQVVIWAAYDMWIEAANVRPYKDTKTKVEERLKKYEQYLPTQSEGLQESIKEGQSYHIGCWINKATKARFRAD